MQGLTDNLVAFTLAAALLTVTPGIDTALVLRTLACDGARRAGAAAFGICLGCLVWGLAVALGLGILLDASRLAYDVLRWCGAAWLIWLGVQLLRSKGESPGTMPAASASNSAWFRRGLLTNLLNPKVGAFYVSFLPIFVPPGYAPAPVIALLAAIHVGLGLLWFALLIASAKGIAPWLRRRAVARALDRLTGAVLIAAGAKLALTR